MTTSLFIVRHGESTWNAVRRWQGRADPPLSEFGERQARDAAIAVGRLGQLDGIVTSSLRRARQTGALIAEAVGIPLAEPMVELSERSAGPWEGLTRSEINERFPGFLSIGSRPDGYETDESVVDRALAAIDALATDWAGRRLLVVSHGGVIHALERHAGVETGEWQRLDNLEGRWFHRSDLVLRADRVLRADGERVHLLDAETTPCDVDGYV